MLKKALSKKAGKKIAIASGITMPRHQTIKNRFDEEHGDIFKMLSENKRKREKLEESRELLLKRLKKCEEI